MATSKPVHYPAMLALSDLAKCTEDQIRNGLVGEWGASVSQLAGFKILVAYESVGDYGCDSSGYYLFEDKTGALFEVSGGHCSCNGFEGQFTPTPTTHAYLTGETFYVGTGGYDSAADANVEAIKAYVKTLPKPKKAGG